MKAKAKGTFRKLGYRQENSLDERLIAYKKSYKHSFCYIRFDLINKTFEASYYDSKGEPHPQIITPKELLAIQKQIEELGGGFSEC